MERNLPRRGAMGASGPVKLLIADIDGTLVTTAKELTARTCDAVERMRAAGIQLAIVSGRPPRGMAMFPGPLALVTPIGAFNGGIFLKPDLTTVLEQRCLPRDVAEQVVAHLLRAGLDAWVYRGSDWLVRRRDAPRVRHEESTVRFAPTVVDDFRGLLEGVLKVVGVSDDLPMVERQESELRRRFGESVTAARSQPYYLDVTHPGANKATVVRALSGMLGVALDEIAAIGDMPTDVLMFAQAGLGIAMGNSSLEVKRCARFVTTSNDDEGFANAVDRYVLGARAVP